MSAPAASAPAAAPAVAAPAAAAAATGAGAAAAPKKDASGWCAMESNPEVLTRFLHNLGAASNFAFTDMLGLDTDLIAMIPAPVLAVVLLFPRPNSNAATAAADGKEKAAAAAPASAAADAKPAAAADAKAADGKAAAAAGAAAEPFFVIQTPELGNACGTVATLHAVFNTPTLASTLSADSPVRAFMAAAAKLSPRERGVLLSGYGAIKAKHDAHVVQGQTASSGDAEEDTEHHFVVFVPFAGQLYELDGMQSAPQLRGALTAADGSSFAADAAKAIGTHYINNPKFGGSVSFSMIALTGNASAL